MRRLGSTKTGVGVSLQGVCVFACLATMGMYWVRVLSIGPFTLEAYHVGMLLAMAGTGVSIRAWRPVIRAIMYSKAWMVAFWVYIALLLPAVIGTPGFGIWVRQIFFATGFLCLAGYYSVSRQASTTLLYGSLAGIVLFFVVLEYSARLVGTSTLSALVQFVSSGNFNVLIYRFFRPAFNALVDADGDLAFVAAVTNSVAASLFVLAVCFCIGANGRASKLMIPPVLLTVLILIILLDARSVLVVALLAGGVAFVVTLWWKGEIRKTDMAWLAVGALAILIIGLTIISVGGAALDSVVIAMSFEDASTKSRVSQYQWAVYLIERQTLFGSGWIEGVQGLPIHNLFLSAWAYAGIFSFLAAIIFYIGILWIWLMWLYRCLTGVGYWVINLQIGWVATLPILPLFRVWVTGGGGHLGFGEWVALAVFTGLLMRNESERRWRQLTT